MFGPGPAAFRSVIPATQRRRGPPSSPCSVASTPASTGAMGGGTTSPPPAKLSGPARTATRRSSPPGTSVRSAATRFARTARSLPGCRSASAMTPSSPLDLCPTARRRAIRADRAEAASTRRVVSLQQTPPLPRLAPYAAVRMSVCIDAIGKSWFSRLPRSSSPRSAWRRMRPRRLASQPATSPCLAEWCSSAPERASSGSNRQRFVAIRPSGGSTGQRLSDCPSQA